MARSKSITPPRPLRNRSEFTISTGGALGSSSSPKKIGESTKRKKRLLRTSRGDFARNFANIMYMFVFRTKFAFERDDVCRSRNASASTRLTGRANYLRTRLCGRAISVSIPFEKQPEIRRTSKTQTFRREISNLSERSRHTRLAVKRRFRGPYTSSRKSTGKMRRERVHAIRTNTHNNVAELITLQLSFSPFRRRRANE